MGGAAGCNSVALMTAMWSVQPSNYITGQSDGKPSHVCNDPAEQTSHAAAAEAASITYRQAGGAESVMLLSLSSASMDKHIVSM